MTYVNRPDRSRGATVRWVFADATARTNFAPQHGGADARPPSANDIGSEAWQLSDDSFWSLKSIAPNVWVAKGSGGGGGTGNVTGPGTSTDKALARFSGTNGQTIQDGHVKESDAGVLTNTELGCQGANGDGGTFPLGASTQKQTTVTAAGTDTLAYPCADTFCSFFEVYAVGIDGTNGRVYARRTIITAIRYAGAPGGAIATTLGAALFDEFDPAVTGVSTGWDATFVAYAISSNNFQVTVKADPAHSTKWTIAIRVATIPFTP